MDRATLLQTLRDIVERSVGTEVSDIDESKNLREDLGLDSIDLVSMVIEVQSTFNIELKNEELMGLVQVKDLLDLIQSKIAAQGSQPATPAGGQEAPAGDNRAA